MPMYLSFIEPASSFNLSYAVAALAMPIIETLVPAFIETLVPAFIEPLVATFRANRVQTFVTFTLQKVAKCQTH